MANVPVETKYPDFGYNAFPNCHPVPFRHRLHDERPIHALYREEKRKPYLLKKIKSWTNRVWILIPVLIIGSIISFAPGNGLSVGNPDLKPSAKLWEEQLNEMNYLIMRTSSINIIYGLYLTSQQAEALKLLAKKVEALQLPVPDTKGKTNDDLAKIRSTYLLLTEYLKKQNTVPDSLKDRVYKMRELESEIIKKSVLGAQQAGRAEGDCIKCHATPENFPKGDISKMDTKAISEKERKEIDLAHVRGLFLESGTRKLWELKAEVDQILTNGQKYMLKNFRCCLIPPNDLKDPANIGQVFVTNEWIAYFRDIRKLPDKKWNDYKQLYFIPVEDVIKATLPGIKQKNKKEILSKFESVIMEARKMDEIDFELQKEQLCLKLRDALKVDFLTGESKRSKEDRQFIAAMFLLFPGSSEIYDEIIKNNEPVKK